MRHIDDDEEEDDDEMAGFIEDDEEDGEQQPRERAPKSTFRAARAGFGGIGAGLSKEVWEEITEIFGTGHDFEWAMTLEEPTDARKPEVQLEDVRSDASCCSCADMIADLRAQSNR